MSRNTTLTYAKWCQVDEGGVSRQVAVHARVNKRCGMRNARAGMRVLGDPVDIIGSRIIP